MSRRNPILTFSLCASLIVHGLALSAVAWWVIEHTPAPKLAALDRSQILLEQMLKSTPPPQPRVPPAKKSKPPEPKKTFEKPDQKLKDDSGETNGRGTANRSTAGLNPMQAREGPEQADLMKQADKFDDDAFLPASKGSQTGGNAASPKSPAAGVFSESLATHSKPPVDLKNTLAADLPVPRTPGNLPVAEIAKPTAATASGAKNPMSNVPVSQVPTPKSVQKEVVGHRATVSDSESMAPAAENHLVFRAGKVEGREGLKVKTSQPRYSDASVHDIEVIGDAHNFAACPGRC